MTDFKQAPHRQRANPTIQPVRAESQCLCQSELQFGRRKLGQFGFEKRQITRHIRRLLRVLEDRGWHAIGVSGGGTQELKERHNIGRIRRGRIGEPQLGIFGRHTSLLWNRRRRHRKAIAEILLEESMPQ